MDSNIINELKRLSKYFIEAPYGQQILNGNKTLPPNYEDYKRQMDNLTNILLQLDKSYITASSIEQIRSLRDNQLMVIIANKTKYNKEFKESSVVAELELISQHINTTINDIITKLLSSS